MAITMRNRTALTRRAVMKSTVATAACTAIGGIAYPSLSFAPGRPQITHGIQSGDVSADSGVVWARADRPARMLVEVATTDTFRDIRRAVFVDALPESDFTAKALLDDLPPGQDIWLGVISIFVAVAGILSLATGIAENSRIIVRQLYVSDQHGGWQLDTTARISDCAESQRHDRFIPVRKEDLFSSLIKQGDLADPAERELFWRFARTLRTICHYEYSETLDRLRDDYYY